MYCLLVLTSAIFASPQAIVPDVHPKPCGAQLDAMGYAREVEPSSSGIDMIIVGCGFAGITCAIESARKGHSVMVLEKYEEIRMIGMLVLSWVAINTHLNPIGDVRIR